MTKMNASSIGHRTIMVVVMTMARTSIGLLERILPFAVVFAGGVVMVTFAVVGVVVMEAVLLVVTVFMVAVVVIEAVFLVVMGSTVIANSTTMASLSSCRRLPHSRRLPDFAETCLMTTCRSNAPLLAASADLKASRCGA